MRAPGARAGDRARTTLAGPLAVGGRLDNGMDNASDNGRVVAERIGSHLARTGVVWDVLRSTLAGHPPAGTTRADIIDVGGGTGGFAVPLAQLGYRVVVVDPSPDSLAALARRSAESGVSDRVAGVQGDVVGLSTLLPGEQARLVLCHSVLEVVDDPVAATAALSAVLAPGGAASILAANRSAAVLGRAVVGRVDEALAVLTDPAGRWGAGDPLARRFTLAELTDLVRRAGLRVGPVHGVRVVADLVPSAVLNEPATGAAVVDLERALSDRPEFLAVAAQLHILGYR